MRDPVAGGVSWFAWTSVKPAIPEALPSQTVDGVGNRDAFQARAFIEAPISQTGDGVWNRDAGQSRATIETPISQTVDGVGNRGVFTATQHRICGSLDDGIAIFA